MYAHEENTCMTTSFHQEWRFRTIKLCIGHLLTQKLHKQCNVGPMLMISQSLQIFNGCHHELVDRYEISISQMSMDLLSEDFFFNSSITDKISKPHLTCYKKPELLTLREHLCSVPV